MAVRIEIDIFSGRPNPVVIVDGTVWLTKTAFRVSGGGCGSGSPSPGQSMHIAEGVAVP